MLKMIIAIVQDQDTPGLIEDLTDNDFRVTRLSSTGGFLKAGNSTLLIGVEEEEMDEAIRIIEVNCRTREMTTSLMTSGMPGDTYIPYPVQVKVGGATLFILDVDEHIKI